MTTTRRSLLSICALAVLPGPGRTSTSVRSLGQRLAALHRDPTSARRIAAAYLAGLADGDKRRAADDLQLRPLFASAVGITEPTLLRAWLAARIRDDFSTGAVLDVAGWRLSRSEVAACVVVAAV